MKRRWKKFLAGVLSAALALNLAAPLALAGSSTMGAACGVTNVLLYPGGTDRSIVRNAFRVRYPITGVF